MNRIWKALAPLLVMSLVAAAPARSETMAPAGAPVSHDLKQAARSPAAALPATPIRSAQNSTRRSRRSARPSGERQGTVSFRKPGRMRWEFSDPEQANDRQRRRDALQLRPGPQPGRRDAAEAGAQIDAARLRSCSESGISTATSRPRSPVPPTPTASINLMLDAENTAATKSKLDSIRTTLQSDDVDAHRPARRRDQDRFQRHSRQCRTARFDLRFQRRPPAPTS